MLFVRFVFVSHTDCIDDTDFFFYQYKMGIFVLKKVAFAVSLEEMYYLCI